MSESTPREHRAAAISYTAQDSAPRVVAKGYGTTAQAILERAQEHGLYVHRSQELVDLLMRVDLDDRIPAALYHAIAEILAWVYALEEQVSGGMPGEMDQTIRPNGDVNHRPGR